ncbi:MAG: barstar family protein [Planctomycetes bacterium]|nr:barstar family protein [Planctomycetota bacterium]
MNSFTNAKPHRNGQFMDSPPARFHFFDDPASCSTGDSLIVQIPAGIVNKHELLAVLAKGLDFPDYFGWNWDAFDECLRDLSWIDDSRRIVLFHEDVPFEPHSEERSIYLEILREAIAASVAEQSYELIVIFPTASQAEIGD